MILATGFTNEEEEEVQLTHVVPFLVEDELLRLGGRFEKVGNWKVFAITDTGGSAACTGIQAAGAYTYTLKSNQLKLTATFDQCSGRKTILTTHPLTKIGV